MEEPHQAVFPSPICKSRTLLVPVRSPAAVTTLSLLAVAEHALDGPGRASLSLVERNMDLALMCQVLLLALNFFKS
jgi:hypothetical protein